MDTLLEPYRRLIRPLRDSSTTVTKTFRQAAIQATMRLWGIDPEAEEANPAKLRSAMTAAGLLVSDQAPHCIERIKARGASQQQLELLNEFYEIDGLRLRLGNMTPRQVREKILTKLVEQQSALNEQARHIRRLLRQCPFENRLIVEQIRKAPAA